MESQHWVMCVWLRYIYDECISPATIRPTRFSCKVSDIFADFNRIRNFSTDFHIRLQNKNFTGIRRVGTAMPMMEVQRIVAKLAAVLSNDSDAPRTTFTYLGQCLVPEILNSIFGGHDKIMQTHKKIKTQITHKSPNFLRQFFLCW